MILITLLVFILILGLLIFVHELGHFIVAKRSGMEVEEFGFGFPPRIIGIKKRGTIYSLNLIPLGGFVKILGEDGHEHGPGSFGSKPALNRFAVLVAGVSMNFILAWLLLSIGLTLGLPTLITEGERLPDSATIKDSYVTVLYVDEESPAAAVGVRSGDAIVSVDEKQFKTIQGVQDYTSLRAGQQLDYTFIRGEQEFMVSIIPRANPPEGEGPIGVLLGQVGKVSYPWYESIYKGLTSAASLAVRIIVAIGTLLRNLFADGSALASLTGPVGIAVMTRDAINLGAVNVIYFTAVLSLNLAILNILPFPALDGGRIVFLIVEKIRRKKIATVFEHYANTFGFLLLILLMIWVTIRDVGKFSGEISGVWDKLRSLL